nr:MFS transporter [Microlunatus panaciterrae]
MLVHARRPVAPVPSFFILTAASTLLYALTFTVNLVYMVTVVGLDPLQMVLVGTVLEVTCFLFEIPTGIVADLHSRRLSILIGLVLIGCAFLLQGMVPTFAAMLAVQLIWGVGYTFTSGATEAWITDEQGAEEMAPVFTRAQQISLGATFAGTVAAGLLGIVDIRTPMVLSGAGFLLLAGWLVLTMPEDHFHPVPRHERDSFEAMGRSFVGGLALVRRRAVVRSLFLISLIAGLASEAFDRLWTVRILKDFALPTLFGSHEPVVWFAVFSLVGTLVSLLASLAVNRISPARVSALHPRRLLALLSAVQTAGIVGLALSGNLWLALAALWVKGAAEAVAIPIQAAWLNRNVESHVRATVLSMNGQANAIGQVVGGPPLGLLGNRTSVRTTLLASAVVTVPITLIFARMKPARVEAS